MWWRVRIGGVEVQIRGLVLGLFGDVTAFEKRARQWAEENFLNQVVDWDEDWLEDLQ